MCSSTRDEGTDLDNGVLDAMVEGQGLLEKRNVRYYTRPGDLSSTKIRIVPFKSITQLFLGPPLLQ